MNTYPPKRQRNTSCESYNTPFIHSPSAPISSSLISLNSPLFFFFFLNDPAPPEFSPLPLHDALPICQTRNMVRASARGSNHPAAPHGNSMLLARIVNAPRHRVPADAPKFDVDDFAGAQLDGGARLLFRVDALVQADRRVQPFLQLDVAVEIVPAERLLDHHQVEAFELLEERPILQRVGGVGVDHQLDARKILAQAAHQLQVLPWLDFYLDALVAGRKFLLHRGRKFIQRFLDSHRDAASDLLANAANQFCKWNAFLLGLRIPYGCFQGSLGHVVSADTLEQIPDIICCCEFLTFDPRPKKIAKDEPRGIDHFRAVV